MSKSKSKNIFEGLNLKKPVSNKIYNTDLKGDEEYRKWLLDAVSDKNIKEDYKTLLEFLISEAPSKDVDSIFEGINLGDKQSISTINDIAADTAYYKQLDLLKSKGYKLQDDNPRKYSQEQLADIEYILTDAKIPHEFRSYAYPEGSNHAAAYTRIKQELIPKSEITINLPRVIDQNLSNLEKANESIIETLLHEATHRSDIGSDSTFKSEKVLGDYLNKLKTNVKYNGKFQNKNLQDFFPNIGKTIGETRLNEQQLPAEVIAYTTPTLFNQWLQPEIEKGFYEGHNIYGKNPTDEQINYEGSRKLLRHSLKYMLKLWGDQGLEDNPKYEYIKKTLENRRNDLKYKEPSDNLSGHETFGNNVRKTARELLLQQRNQPRITNRSEHNQFTFPGHETFGNNVRKTARELLLQQRNQPRITNQSEHNQFTFPGHETFGNNVRKTARELLLQQRNQPRITNRPEYNQFISKPKKLNTMEPLKMI